MTQTPRTFKSNPECVHIEEKLGKNHTKDAEKTSTLLRDEKKRSAEQPLYLLRYE